MTRSAPKNRNDLVALAAARRRRLETVYTLTMNNDPWMAEIPFRLALAQWFIKQYNRLGIRAFHARRIHYALISQKEPVLAHNGEPFGNTEKCWEWLCSAVKDARYLGLISHDIVTDRRNPAPHIHRWNEDDAAAEVWVEGGGVVQEKSYGLFYEAPTYGLPELQFSEPKIGQRYHIEVWIEKSSQNDILLPLGLEYGINICTFEGEVSATACKDLINRATSERPVRILYISDFDPAGQGMPISASVKIDFLLNQDDRDLDIRLEPVALNQEQCIEYELPRTPIKDKERRAAGFEERFGEGATELDALEATHPGELRRILVEHIERYYDGNLASKIRRAAEAFGEEIAEAEARILQQYDAQIRALDNLRNQITSTFKAVHGPAYNAYREAVTRAHVAYDAAIEPARQQVEELERRLTKQAEALIETIGGAMLDAAPNPDELDWPNPAEGDGDDGPLYDSTRDYLEQVDRFREHQGKGEDVGLAEDRVVTRACKWCGREYTTSSKVRIFCSSRCRDRSKRAPRDGLQHAQGDNSTGETSA